MSQSNHRLHLPTTLHESIQANAGLSFDEKCWLAMEFNKNGHRIQRLVVRRGDLELDFDEDLGLASKWPLSPVQFNAPLLGLYNVGEAMDICQRAREDKDPEPQEASDIWENWRKAKDEQRQWAAHRSVFGPGVNIQRN